MRPLVDHIDTVVVGFFKRRFKIRTYVPLLIAYYFRHIKSHLQNISERVCVFYYSHAL